MATPLEDLEAGFISSHYDPASFAVGELRFRFVFLWRDGKSTAEPFYDSANFVEGYSVVFLRQTRARPSVLLEIRRRRLGAVEWEQASFLVNWRPVVHHTKYGYTFRFTIAKDQVHISFYRSDLRQDWKGSINTSSSSSPDRSKKVISLSTLSELTFRHRVASSFRSSKRSPGLGLGGMRKDFLIPNPVRHNTGYYRVIANAPGDVTPVPLEYESYYRGYSSVKTPGFWKIKNRRRLPDNPYSLSLIITHDRMGADIRKKRSDPAYVNTTITRTSEIWPVGAGNPSYSGYLYNECVRKLMTRTESGVSNLAQDFAQIGQTVDMIADTATRIHRANRQARQGNLLGAWKSLTNGKRGQWKGKRNDSSPMRNLADNWLALQYGWKPLLSDIRGSAEALARLNMGDYTVKTSRVSADVTKNVSSTPVVGPDGSIIGSKNISIQESCRMGVRWRVDDGIKAFLQQTGFTNPINLAWELVPYSFVVDWFVPIGPWLESLTAFDGLEFLGGYMTRFQRRVTTSVVDWDGDFKNDADGHGYARGSYDELYVTFDRSTLSSFPTLHRPTFKNPFSVTHALNAISLMVAGFRLR